MRCGLSDDNINGCSKNSGSYNSGSSSGSDIFIVLAIVVGSIYCIPKFANSSSSSGSSSSGSSSSRSSSSLTGSSSSSSSSSSSGSSSLVVVVVVVVVVVCK